MQPAKKTISNAALAAVYYRIQNLKNEVARLKKKESDRIFQSLLAPSKPTFLQRLGRAADHWSKNQQQWQKSQNEWNKAYREQNLERRVQQLESDNNQIGHWEFFAPEQIDAPNLRCQFGEKRKMVYSTSFGEPTWSCQ